MKKRSLKGLYMAFVVLLLGILLIIISRTEFLPLLVQESNTPGQLNITSSKTITQSGNTPQRPTRTETTTPTIWIGTDWGSNSTFPPATAEAKVKELYDNPPCRFPCWWNIIPGKTQWTDAWEMLSPLASNLGPWQYELELDQDNPNYYVYGFFPDNSKGSNSQPDLTDMIFYINKRNIIIDYIDINAKKHTTYSLGRILKDYGEPKEILFMGVAGQGVYSSHLFMYYPNVKFLADFFAVVEEKSIKNGMANLCYLDSSFLLWGEDIKISSLQAAIMEEAEEEVILNFSQPLEEVINMNNRSFYETYKGKGTNVCLEVEIKYLEH